MFSDLNEILRFRANSMPERTALIFEGREITYQELNNLATAAALFLLERKIGPGHRIAILDFNNPAALLLWLGAQRIGAVAVYCNWRFSSVELEYILKDSESRLLFYGESFTTTIDELRMSASFRESLQIVSIEKFYATIGVAKDADSDHAYMQPPSHQIAPEDILIQLYTSGTTGYPKGVLVPHRSLLSMVQGLVLELPGFGSDSCNLIAAPLFNIAGTGYAAISIYSGIVSVLHKKFDPVQVAADIEIYSVSNIFLAPAMIHSILNLPEVDGYSFKSLRNVHYGGSPMTRVLLEKASSVFGCDFTQGYGLTETSGIATLLRYDDHRAALSTNATEKEQNRLLSAGRPVGGMEVKIFDDDKNEVSTGQAGEVCIRGSNLSRGYWGKDVAFIDNAGWFHSGDIGQLDASGFLYLIDRKNDMILSGGMNIYPSEIERLLEGHPEIDEAAIVGVPDEKFGEKICAFVVCRSEELSLADVRDWLQGKVARYKYPALMFKKKCLPRNPTGKVLRRQLRDPFWAEKERKI